MEMLGVLVTGGYRTPSCSAALTRMESSCLSSSDPKVAANKAKKGKVESTQRLTRQAEHVMEHIGYVCDFRNGRG